MRRLIEMTKPRHQIVLFIVVCIGILVPSGVVLAESVKKSAGVQFKDWGMLK
jgi:LPS O-antigen subunit length determinant protein (WzzB/FepE family)